MTEDNLIFVAVLAQYEVSKPMRSKIVERFGEEVRYVTVADLRRRGLAAMLRYLRSLNVTHVIVAAESEGALQATSILKALAAIIPAREYFLVRWDDRIEPFSRIGQVVTALRVAIATLYAVFLIRRIRASAEYLKDASRIPFRPISGRRSVAYVNGNLSFGLMAGGSIGHIAGVVNAFTALGWAVKYFGSTEVKMVRDAESVILRTRRSFCLPFDANLHIFGYDIVDKMTDDFEREQYCFIYQRLSLANFSGVGLSRKFNVPLVVEYNGSEVWTSRHWGSQIRYEALAELAEEAMLRHAHLLVTISAPLRDELLSRGVEPERIVLYPNCIDPIIFDPSRFSGDETRGIRRQLDVAEDACVVMFVGTFGLWHGAEVLAEAILHIAEREPARLERSKAVFVFVGAGVTLPKVQAALAAPSVARFVRFTGLVPQEHAPAYLAAADICVSPHVENPDGSRFFGSPTKLFEYMAMGKPIVASKLEQIGEVLSPGIGPDDIRRGSPTNDHPHALAALTTPGCVEELARAILFLIESPDWRRHLGENARAEALAKYTWSAHVGAILDRVSAFAA